MSEGIATCYRRGSRISVAAVLCAVALFACRVTSPACSNTTVPGSNFTYVYDVAAA